MSGYKYLKFRIEFGIVLISFVAWLILAPVACTKPEHAVEVLKSQGYDNIKTGGYPYFVCDKNDEFATEFTANLNGREVKGVVCEGLMKGATVRFR